MRSKLRRLAESARRRRGPRAQSDGGPFLAPEELAQFVSDYPKFPRTVVTDRRYRQRQRKEVGQAASELVDKTTSGFRCGVVAVHEGDGMSWAATAADRAVAEAHPDLERIHLRGAGSTTRLPAIGRWVPARILVKHARRAGVTEKFRVLSGWVVAAPFVAVPIALIEAWRSSGFEPAALADPLLIAAVAGVTGLELAREIAISRTTESSSSSMQQLAAAFAEASTTDQEAHDRVVRGLAAQLALGPFPRFVIVDDFGRLDATTARVLRHYIAHEAGRNGPETWLLFEDASEKTLWDETVGATARRLQRYELELLGDEERRRLATHAGTDRFDYATVRGVRGVVGFDEGDDLDRFLLDFRLSNPAPDTGFDELELLYLLSLTAAWGRGPTLSLRELESKLSKGGKVRAELLGRFLGSEPTLHELRTRMDAMVAKLGRLVDVTVPDESRFERELEFHRADAGRALAEHAHRYDLPSAALGHLFWAVFWHDWLQARPVEPFWAHRLSIHLVEGLPGIHDHSPSEAVVDTLFESVVDTVRWCIHSCVLDQVSDLLDAALTLVDGDAAAERRAQRLLRLAWEAYGVLGDERVLATIMTIESWRGDDAPKAATPARLSSTAGSAAVHVSGWSPASVGGAGNALEQVFLESLSVRQDRVTASWRRVLGSRDAGATALHTYGQVRGAWLAVTITYLDTWEALPADVLFPAARKGAWQLMGDIVDACARLEQSEETDLAAVDYLNVSIGLWTLALLHLDGPRGLDGDLDPLVQALERIAEVAAGLHQDAVAATAHGGNDFVVHVLARELVVVLAAVTNLMADRTDGPAAARLARIAGDSLGLLASTPHGPARRPIAQEVARQLNLLAVTWGRLGVPQLSAYADLRAAQYEVLRSSGNSLERFTHIAKALAPEIGHAGHIGLLAKMILAAAAEWSADVAAQVVCVAATDAINDGIGNEVATEVALVALRASHAHSVNIEEVLDYLVASDAAGHPNRLERWLERASDDQLGIICLVLLNSLDNASGRPDLESRVLRALDERRALISDPEAMRLVRDEIDASVLRRELMTSDRIDVEAIVTAWRDRESAKYAWVLYLLRRSPNELLATEIAVLLETTEPPMDQSAFILLAISSGHHGRRYGGELGARVVRAAVEFVAGAIDHWERDLPADENIGAYRLLRDHYPERKELYKRKLLYWDLAQHERDALGKIPSLYEQGRYFTLFSHFCSSLFHWGLPVDEPDEIRQGLTLSDEEARDHINSWRESGAPVPAPFATGNGSHTLSARFFTLGRHLFSQSASHPTFEEAQSEFDEAARQSMETLYAMIATLRSIPDEIQQVFQGHRERFASYKTLS